MSWALISDSSCNLRDWQPTAPHTTFAFAPLKIRVGEREFVDDLRSMYMSSTALFRRRRTLLRALVPA